MFYKADQGQMDAECFFISHKRYAVLLFRCCGHVSYFFSHENIVYHLSFSEMYSTNYLESAGIRCYLRL